MYHPRSAGNGHLSPPLCVCRSHDPRLPEPLRPPLPNHYYHHYHCSWRHWPPCRSGAICRDWHPDWWHYSTYLHRGDSRSGLLLPAVHRQRLPVRVPQPVHQASPHLPAYIQCVLPPRSRCLCWERNLAGHRAVGRQCPARQAWHGQWYVALGAGVCTLVRLISAHTKLWPRKLRAFSAVVAHLAHPAADPPGRLNRGQARQ